MSNRTVGLALAGLSLLPLGVAVNAQTAAPTSYTVTQVNSMFGTPVNMKIYRNGDKAVIDNTANGKTIRAVYDLKTQKNVSWDLAEASPLCGGSNYSGDWGDPFNGGDLLTELKKENAKEVGTETVNGITSKVYATDGSGPQKVKAKAWVDNRFGAIVKLQMEQNGTAQTMLEIKSLTLGAPPAAVFAIPAACKWETANAAPIANDGDRWASETGGQANDFVDAVTSPDEKQKSCSAVFRIVQAGSMQPISGVRIKVDRNYDPDNPAASKPQDMTAQVHNGSLNLGPIGPEMNFSLRFSEDAGADALIHRQCFAPTTVLLLVVKNPAKITDGTDWLWVKSGKFAK